MWITAGREHSAKAKVHTGTKGWKSVPYLGPLKNLKGPGVDVQAVNVILKNVFKLKIYIFLIEE
jgi:hypothetical protein